MVEEEIHLTLVELCHVCNVPEDQVRHWVGEGVLEPMGEAPQGMALCRRFAAPDPGRDPALARDLELNPPGVALALDLLDEIESLRAHLRRLGGGGRR